MHRLIISLAVASVFTTAPTLTLAAPRLIDSRDYMQEAVSVGVITSEELLALGPSGPGDGVGIDKSLDLQ